MAGGGDKAGIYPRYLAFLKRKNCPCAKLIKHYARRRMGVDV
jgi:hypothetical protein